SLHVRTGLAVVAGRMDDKKSSEMGFPLSSKRMLSCPSYGMNTSPLSGKVLGMAMPTLDMQKRPFMDLVRFQLLHWFVREGVAVS
ncbi:hypothetical protein Dimus_025200, partial [Dionaea muscipula]